KTVPGRLAALDEACQIILGMFTQPKTTVHGRHYSVTDAMCNPKPLQQPHPPIMIGGTGKQLLLKLVAKYADMWNASGNAATMRELIDVIQRHGDAVGRDTGQIEKTVMVPLCYKAAPAREEFMCSLMANMRQTTPEDARG